MNKNLIFIAIMLFIFALFLGYGFYQTIPDLVKAYEEGAQEIYLFTIVWPISLTIAYIVNNYYLSGNTRLKKYIKNNIYVLVLVLSSLSFLLFQYVDQNIGS